MNRLVFILLMEFLTLSCTEQIGAQSTIRNFEEVDHVKKVRSFIWGDERSRADFSLGQAKRYEAEGAVFLKDESYLKLFKKGKRLGVVRLTREVVLIQDKAALNDFSILKVGSMNELGKKADLGVRIFKSQDQVLTVGAEEFVPMEDGLKVALPQLEIGDIVDFYSYEIRQFYIGGSLVFEPDEEFLISGYPVLHYYSEHLIGEDCYMKFVPMNGAPAPRIITQDNKGSKIKAKAIIDEQDIVPRTIEQRWSYVYRDLPVIRYIAAIHGDISLLDELITMGPNMSIGTQDEQIKSMLERFLKEDSSIEPLSLESFAGLYETVLDQNLSSDRLKVEEFYDRICHMARSNNPELLPELDSWTIIRGLAAFCREEGIPSSWVYVMPAYLGTTEDMLISDDLHRLLRIDFKEGYLLIDRGDIFLPLGYYPSYEEGSEAYLVPNTNKKSNEFEVETWTVPYSSYTDNVNVAILDLELHEDSLKGEVRMSSKGHESSGLTRNCNAEFFNCDVLASFLPKQENVIKKGMQGDDLYEEEELRFLVKRDEKLMAEMDQSSPYKDLGQFSNWMIGTIDDELKGRFRLVQMEDVQSVQILSDGLDSYDKDFTYSTSITLSEVIQELGEDRLLTIGPLIGSQVDIPEAESSRSSDIRMPYARSYITEMSIKIPSEYSVEGLEELNSHIANRTGSFRSQAFLTGNTIKIRTEKVYKNAFEKSESWPLMLEFLNAAYDFSKKKVLLKRKPSEINPEQG